jgi:hypothetical protein
MEVREALQENTSERGIARNEVKTVYEAKQKNMCVYGHM